MIQSLMVVCIGNICRSPVGEALLKRAFPEKKIWSAGLGALEGNGADANAVAVATKHGLDLSGHVAQQIQLWMCEQADLILVMESAHVQELSARYPLTRGKVHRVGEFCPPDAAEIPDPYRQSYEIFEQTHQLIETGISHWIERIRVLS